MSIEKRGVNPPDKNVNGASREMVVPEPDTLATPGIPGKEVQLVYPKDLKAITTTEILPTLKTPSALREDQAPPFHELVKSDGKRQHYDLLGNKEDTAAAVTASIVPILHERPDARILIMDTTGTTSNKVIDDLKRRGYTDVRADSYSPSQLLGLGNAGVEQVADSLAKAINTDDDKKGQATTRETIRTIGNALLDQANPTDDPDFQPPKVTLPVLKVALEGLLDRRHVGDEFKENLFERTYPTDEERAEMRGHFRDLLGGVNDLLAQDKPQEDEADAAGQPLRVQAFQITEDGRDDMVQKLNLLAARMTQIIATDVEHGTPALFVSIGNDRLSPTQQTRLEQACIANGVDSISAYTALPHESSIMALGIDGPVVVMGTVNGHVAKKLEELSGTYYGEQVTGRGSSKNHSVSESETHDVNKTRTQQYGQDRDGLGRHKKAGYSVTETDHRTKNVTESRSADESESLTVGQFPKVRADQFTDTPPGGGIILERGKTEVRSFYLPVDAAIGLHEPFALQVKREFPEIEVYQAPPVIAETVQKPSVLRLRDRMRFASEQPTARSVRSAMDADLATAERLREEMQGSGLRVGQFVDMATGERIAPRREDVRPYQAEVFRTFVEQRPEVQRATLVRMAADLPNGPEVVVRAFTRDQQSTVAHEILEARALEGNGVHKLLEDAPKVNYDSGSQA